MKLKNISNYPRIVSGTRIEPEQVEEVDVSNEDEFRSSDKFEVVEDDDNSSDKDVKDGDVETNSKPQKNKDEKGE